MEPTYSPQKILLKGFPEQNDRLLLVKESIPEGWDHRKKALRLDPWPSHFPHLKNLKNVHLGKLVPS